MAVAVATPSELKTFFYRPELDALRFGAFFMVFFTHITHFDAHTFSEKLHFSGWLTDVAVNVSRAGAFGVYLFFTLSAYLITSLLLREKNQFGRLHVKAFYVRRALRIWPLYFFILLCGITYHPADLKVMPYFLLFAGNWAEVADKLPSFFIMALWSISVEEQFYLLWPPIVSRLSRTGIRNAAIAMLAAPIVFLPIGFALGLNGWRFGFLNSFSCISAMGTGILLALYRVPQIPRLALFPVGLMSLYAGSALNLGAAPLSSIVAVILVNVFSACALVACLGLTANRSLLHLGKISYGLYVYHPIALGLISAFLGERLLSLKWQAVMVSAGFIATVALASASYRWLESPFLKLKERFSFIHSRPI